MSTLVDKKYEGNDGRIYRLRLTSDFAAAAGTEPTGKINTYIKPKISKSKREYGIRPRGVRLVRIIGTPPDTFRKYAFLPVLTRSEWLSNAFSPGVMISLGTTVYTVLSRVEESL